MPSSSRVRRPRRAPSFFTRKVTGYLDYKRLPWWLSPDAGSIPAARAAGWRGGIPVVATPDGEMIWDSTALILHLDRVHPEPSVTPPGKLAFLDFLIDDFVDEWLYRPAIGTRWLYEENRVTGSWEIAREASYSTAVPAEIAAQLESPPPPPAGDSIRAFVTAAMAGAMRTAGVDADNIDPWMARVGRALPAGPRRAPRRRRRTCSASVPHSATSASSAPTWPISPTTRPAGAGSRPWRRG